ncbi:unnamed protein product [Pleuronectes platessa]|uniref:Uncharacterized protein n=1 Tax=Pleuronectes platessa TaxID=8262 RepID=A0A9N7W0Y4_PLEPL|nr:unnamed protein product [Pleuronectes platessa]
MGEHHIRVNEGSEQYVSSSRYPPPQLRLLEHRQRHHADKMDNVKMENTQVVYENKLLQGELEDALREMQLAGDNALSEQLMDRDKLDSLTRENLQVASVNKKLQSELVDALRERHVSDISKQRDLDDLTEENHHLAYKSKRVQGELEDAQNDIRLAREAAMIKHQYYTAKLDNVKMENTQVVSENKRLLGEQKDAVQQHHQHQNTRKTTHLLPKAVNTSLPTTPSA